MELWDILFDRALKCLDSIPQTGTPMPEWTFGGGTVLKQYYHHRNSKDIDIFLPNSSYVDILRPDLNDIVGNLTQDYVQDHLFLKLVFREGEIDFIATTLLTSLPYTDKIIHNRLVLVETPEEIIAKKLHFRAGALTVRDVFDIAVVLNDCPDRLWETRSAWMATSPRIIHRLETMQNFYENEIAGLDILPAGEPYRSQSLQNVTEFVKRVYASFNP